MQELKKDIKSMNMEELEAFLKERKQPKFRAKQVFSWLHEKMVLDFGQMTNLPKDLIACLEEECVICSGKLLRKLVSKIDGTIKLLLQFADGECVESVIMQYQHGYSICISSQVGCKMGCTFCASTKAGFVRSLTASEMLEQVYFAQREIGARIGNIVLMGIGEPLDNFDSLVRFLHLISCPGGNNISTRHISVSTCGLVDQIERLADYNFGITLSISLHAPFDELRDQTMPVNHKYPIASLLKACKKYTEKTTRRISYEYALIKGVNDSMECAMGLVHLLKGTLCHINLIPVNEIKETSYRKTDQGAIYRFQEYLVKNGMNATVRRTLGADIQAACGQLRRDQMGAEPQAKEEA